MTDAARDVRLVEVGPRDGLQNQTVPIPTEIKLEWIHRLAAAGLPEVEITSFVHPKWVPQLADCREVASGVRRDDHPGTLFSTLVPNAKGLEGALATGVDRIALFTAASETFNRKNINASIEESLDRFRAIFDSLDNGVNFVRGYVSCCFGCPYEGDVSPAAVALVSKQLIELGCHEVAISDTIGVAAPRDVKTVIEAVATEVESKQIALHFHDTRGTALANVLEGYRLGVRTFDASSGGLGGCPYAPGAAGNVATEDVVYLLEREGITTGIDLDALAHANLWFEEQLGSPLPSRVLATYRS